MSYGDFCRCTPTQFQAAIAARRRHDEGEEHARWESLRWAACAVMQPHIRGRAIPKEIMPLPWDDMPGRGVQRAKDKAPTRIEQRDRLASLMKRRKG